MAHGTSLHPSVVTAEVLSTLVEPLIIDVRDPNEVEAGKGGPPGVIPGSVNVPLNISGVLQSERETTPEEFMAKILAAGITLPDDGTPIITHCGFGARGGQACNILKGLGYNAYNGGGPSHVASAIKAQSS